MTRLEYDLLREQEPWMKLPHWDRFTDTAIARITAISVEDAKVRRLARLLAGDYSINDIPERVYH